MARFQREAQVLASLNHPNIGHIYGLEEAEGTKALVLELVEDPTNFGLAKAMETTPESDPTQYGMTGSRFVTSSCAETHATWWSVPPGIAGSHHGRQSRRRKEPVMEERTAYVGMDAHKKMINVAVLLTSSV